MLGPREMNQDGGIVQGENPRGCAVSSGGLTSSPEEPRVSEKTTPDRDSTVVAQPPPAVSSAARRAKSIKDEYVRNLPHLQGCGGPVFVTFSTWKRWILPETVRGRVLEHCAHDHEKKMLLLCAVVMPDHVHLLYEPLADALGNPFGLEEIVGALKGASAHSVNRLLKRKGHVWQDESFDHVVRTRELVVEKAEYICLNPVRKGLCQGPAEYPWIWLNPTVGDLW